MFLIIILFQQKHFLIILNDRCENIRVECKVIGTGIIKL